MSKLRHCVMEELVITELGFCCFYSFFREVKKYSGRKIALALGVSPNTIARHRNRFLSRETRKCPSCSRPRIQLELNYSASGKPYFVRHRLGS